MKCFFVIITYFGSDILKQDTKKEHILDLDSFSCFRSRDHNFPSKSVCNVRVKLFLQFGDEILTYKRE